MPSRKYVSRGGFKLEGAVEDFGLEIKGRKAIDIGSSTGGFTDFLLKNGASKIIAIDVGYGLLDWNLRNSPLVKVLERTNARYLDPAVLDFKADITMVDVSFISLKKIFEKIIEITVPGGEMLLLLKPQFELGKKDVEKGGVIRDKKLHRKSLSDMISFIGGLPVVLKGISFSKIRGARGNIEFWIYLKNLPDKAESVIYYDKIVDEVVLKAHDYFEVE